MPNPAAIHPQMVVLGSDGEPVGTVDHIENGVRIKLTKSDTDAGGLHHYLPLDWVAEVSDGRVRLNRPGADARREWKPER